MKNPRSLHPGFSLFLTLCLSGASAQAVTQTWQTANADNNWNLTSTNWDAGVVWTNGNDATFASAGETVTVGADAITAGTITYTGSSQCTMSGALGNLTASTININTSGAGKVAIAVGTSDLTNVSSIKITTGTLFLVGANLPNAAITVGGSGNNEGRGAIRVDSSSNLGGTITLTANSVFGSNTGNPNISAGISGGFGISIGSTSPGQINFSGPLTFTGGFTQGTNTTNTISGTANTYAGTTSITAGTLNLTGSIPNSALSIGAAGKLSGEGTAASATFASGATINFDPTTAGAFTSTGTLTIAGSNILTVTPVGTSLTGGTYKIFGHGGTTATAANFALTNAINYRNPVFTVGASDVKLTIDPPVALTWSGTTATWETAGTDLDWNGGTANFFTGDSVTFDDTAANFSPTLAVTVTPAAVVFNNNTAAYTLTGTGLISGPGSLAVNGTSTVTISTPNTFTGGASLNAGRAKAGHAAAFGTGAIQFNGGILSSDGTTARTLTNPWNTSGTARIGDPTDTGAITLSGAGTLNGNATFETLTTSTAASTIAISGIISDGANSYSLTKTGGDGIMTLSGANTYKGGTFINKGRIGAGNLSAYGTGAVTVASGGQAYLTAAGTFTYPMSIAGTGSSEGVGRLGAIRLSGNTLSAAVTLTDDARVTAYGSSGTFSGVIGETGGARKLEIGGTDLGSSGGGTVTLSAANTYTGGTAVNFAIAVASNNAAFGTGPVTLDLAGKNQRIQLADGVNITNALTLGANSGATARGVLEVNATNANATWSGPITVTGATGSGGFFFAATGSTLTLAGPITSASTPLTQRLGTVIYSGGGSYASLGTTGLAKLGAADGIATNAALALGVSGDSNFDLNGFSQTLSNLTRTANTTYVLNNGTDPATLTINYNGGTSSNFNGAITTGTGTLSLTKTGTGTYILDGTTANTYTGTTTISGGKLQIGSGTAGTIAAASPVVNNAALVLNRTGAFTFANAISGTGSVEKMNTGTTTLTGALSYTGNTLVSTSGGTLSISTDTLADASDVKIVTGAVLNLNHSLTDTIHGLYLDGVPQPAGTYGSLTSSADHQVAYITGNGILNVTGVDAYVDWATAKTLTGGNNGKDQDPDNDGLNNLHEFAFGGDPLSGATGSRIASSMSTVNTFRMLVLTVPVRNGAVFSGSPDLSATVDGITYHIQASLDLSAWNLYPAAEVPPADSGPLNLAATPAPDGYTNHFFFVPDSQENPHVFLRAKVMGE
ncbi:MAG: autotransporter-associated beta strand repeat-containing protein [Luteolibacter sp.]